MCGKKTRDDAPCDVFWCADCKTPVIYDNRASEVNKCPLCSNNVQYLSTDLRPVFPEERLLVEIILGEPLSFLEKNVWAADGRYFVDGDAISIRQSEYQNLDPEFVRNELSRFKNDNSYHFFSSSINRFIKANEARLDYLVDEAFTFICEEGEQYAPENIVSSFSGGKDSTVVSDLVVRALQDPSVVHVFGNTTLEFPSTLEYSKRFREDNPKMIFKTAENQDQDFYKVADEIGPPARMMRWCCSMFKTGPITRVFNSIYKSQDILTFYGIRKCESVSRSKYNRVEDSAEAVKIQRQKVAAPIFFWKNLDVWLYILKEDLDFNDAYRLGYDRVGCWCCPNNSYRAQFLSEIYLNEEAKKWRQFLINFAKRIGKPDPEVYVDTGKWKARQGGNGLPSAQSVKIRFSNCTTEDNAVVYNLEKPYDESLVNLFVPFGRIAPELGRSLINETIIIEPSTNVPIISLQPFDQGDFEYAVKVKTMNVSSHADLHRMVKYQIRKFNSCRQCLKCESLCRYGAITISNNNYHISPIKCTRCKRCVTDKYLEGGCSMQKYLRTKEPQ